MLFMVSERSFITALMVCAVIVKIDILYPDPQMRQALLQNVTDAMDEAARLEDERLGDHADSNDVIIIDQPRQPNIPAAQRGASTWTGSSKR
jgi:hypothetical protein